MLGLADDLVPCHPGLALTLGGAVPGLVALAARGKLLPHLCLGPAGRAHCRLVALEVAARTLAPEVEGLEEPSSAQHPGQSRVDVGDEDLHKGKGRGYNCRTAAVFTRCEPVWPSGKALGW